MKFLGLAFFLILASQVSAISVSPTELETTDPQGRWFTVINERQVNSSYRILTSSGLFVSSNQFTLEPFSSRKIQLLAEPGSYTGKVYIAQDSGSIISAITIKVTVEYFKDGLLISGIIVFFGLLFYVGVKFSKRPKILLSGD